jgi:hypothetical protein
LAAAQTVAVVEAGGRTVSLADLLGPRFEAEPHRMFGFDRFHPSAAGYAAAAAILLPTCVAALGVRDERRISPADGEGVTSLSEAAYDAAKVGGTEVTATEVAGRERGPAGRWALLRHRRPWLGQPATDEPEALPPAPRPRSPLGSQGGVPAAGRQEME